ncbi:MAG: DUF2004 domain-containing protein [Sporomusaceae bacterium]|jgi:hypothetical protein|nr:DUF2004 domain-containing protein [Sporomusaceae bacterium]
MANDPILGEIEYSYFWFKKITVNFFGEDVKITLSIAGREDEAIAPIQYEAYQALMGNWDKLQQDFLKPILEYYQTQRTELGYDEEDHPDYPLVETPEQILPLLTLLRIKIRPPGVRDGRFVGICFDCTWDEDGVGLCLLDEKVVEVGYQEIAL